MIENEELVLSELVQSLSESSVYVIPGAGKKACVKDFNGSSQKQESIIKIVWDYQGPSEEILWTLKGGERFDLRIDAPNPDGIKKLALVLENNESSAQYMSGFAVVEIR